MSSRSADEAARDIGGFLEGLREVGYSEGQNVTIEYRWADGQYDRLPALARELVALGVSEIVTTGGLPASLAAKTATATIPIIFALGSDPVEFGLVSSLNRPDGNITGITLFGYLLDSKRVQLVHELIPTARVIAALVNPKNPQARAQIEGMKEVAQAIGQELVILNASNERDYDEVFSTLVHKGADALLVSFDPFFFSSREHLLALARQHRIPAIYGSREFAEAGGLMSYGANLRDAYRQVGVYAGRVLNGEKPSDLPVSQPRNVELVVNLKTAKALDLAIPPLLLARADEVIE